MNVLSLFDGMSCGMIAMLNAGVRVDRYVAYEIDKYATKVSTHNFPDAEHLGDVFEADFQQYQGFDFLVGGSPCTYWSIAQTRHRETTNSGLGWDLFCQYTRALEEAKPRYFIYENNKSMAKGIRDAIRRAFGFEETLINSALVSAQNRQRYYWIGRRNPDGSYSKVTIPQPEDRGILLKDVLDTGIAWRDKSWCVDSGYHRGGNYTHLGYQSGRRFAVGEPVADMNGKSFALTSNYWKGQPPGRAIEKHQCTQVAEPVRVPSYGSEDKSRPVTWSYAKQGNNQVVKNCLSENPNKQQYNMLIQTVRAGCMPSPDGKLKNAQANRVYSVDGKAVTQGSTGGGAGAKGGLYAVPLGQINCPDNAEIIVDDRKLAVARLDDKHSNIQGAKVHIGGKTDTLSPSHVPMVFYALPCEWDTDGIPTKAVSGADGKTYTVYSVKDGLITIKNKQYPIKLSDGYWIIRKLTVSECKRLQTVPDWYDFSVISDTQAYKCLGNGWTCDVITHLINCCVSSVLEKEWIQGDLFG